MQNLYHIMIDMDERICFIGHRDGLPIDIKERLKVAIQNEINLGGNSFTMGTHGDFDANSLSSCRYFKTQNKDVEIIVVITSLNQINLKVKEDKSTNYNFNPYKDVKTVMYEVEEQHFKRRITESNRKMIDECSTLICYVRPNACRSGAKTAMNYAKRKGLKVINLYKEEDDHFNKLVKEEREQRFKLFINGNL